jgi:hypothetical protein
MPGGWADGTIVDHRHLIFDAVDPAGAALSATDHDGDGLSDVILSLPEHPRVADGELTGAAWVVGGADIPAAAGSTYTPDGAGLVLEGAEPGDAAGAAVLGADVNGDGLGDIVIGAPDAASLGGQLLVWYGSSGAISGTISLSTAGSIVTGQPGERIGTALAAIPDSDGDGAEEVAAGADGGAFVSLLLAFELAAADLEASETARILGVGRALGPSPDADRDGQGDLLAAPLGEGADLFFLDFGG